MILLSAMWDCEATSVKDDGERTGELIRVKRKINCVERQIEVSWSYSRITTYIGK